jgi:hypothetical protein
VWDKGKIKMEWQALINIGAGAMLTIAGWFLRKLWEAGERMQRNIHQIEVDLPKHYVRKDEMRDLLNEMKRDHKEDMKEIKEICNKIFLKLDEKADKPT